MAIRTIHPRAATDVLAVNRYPILRLISIVYKLLALGAILLTTATVLIALSAAPDADALVEEFLQSSLGILVGGVVAAISFYALSRLIELFLETNNHTRQIAQALDKQNRMLRQIYRRQANPYPRPSDAIRARQAYLRPDDPTETTEVASV